MNLSDGHGGRHRATSAIQVRIVGSIQEITGRGEGLPVANLQNLSLQSLQITRSQHAIQLVER
jgi:hypothetical protein